MEGNVIELSSDSSAPPSPNVADNSNCPDLPTVLPTEHTPPDDDDLLSISDVEEALGIMLPQKQVHCISDSEESVVAVE
ncbi:hypothetical protein PR048_017394 [Dryococelus australis]|uniref:Uncharacterized protein n=1 Tax=Dryococelus australis TaxID=614101 RepID=A0ABQ9H9D8_9NEOP|nr:hypothetical protein PR048_017394 [Dryococelus australis]